MSVGVTASVAHAQPQADRPAADATADNIGEQPPSPAETMRAYKRAESLVRAWEVESRPAPDAAATTENQPQPVAAAACVVLRYQGEVLGRGVAQAFWGSIGPAANDDPRRRVTAMAIALAIAQANPRLPVGNDLMREAAVQHLTPDILISCELAGRLRPVLADSWAELDLSLNPGLDGLAVHVGKPGEEAQDLASGRTKIVFPSEMMTKNALPQTIVRGLISSAIGEGGAAKLLLSPKELRDKEGVRIWTFRVSHQAQAMPRSEPIFLYRGTVLITTSQMTIGELREMADRLAMNLANRINLDPAVIPGFAPYLPWSDSFADAESAKLSLLMAAAAISHCSSLEEPHPARLIRVWQTLSGVTCDLGMRPTSAAEWAFYGKSSGWWVNREKHNASMTVFTREAFQMAVEAAAAGRSLELSSPRPVSNEIADTLRFDKLSAVERALVLWSFASVGNLTGQSHAQSLTAASRTLTADVRQDQLVSVMPWYGWAEVRAAELRATTPVQIGDAPPMGRDIPSAIALREMRSQCWKHQLNFADITDESSDFLGGIVFTRTSGTKLPTWQCVRPIAFIATMLGDDRLTEPAERQQETFRLILALRFLRQLQVDESCGWMYPDPKKAIGGIRAATWDHSMPPDATSLTLMAVCEAIKSLERLEAESQAKPKQP